MQIPAWMITDEMKQTEHYRMYAEVFGIDVPLTQSQPTESTQGTHRKPSAPRSPNPDKEVAESSAPRRSTMMRLRIPERRSTRVTPPTLVPTVDKEDEMILQDTLQVSLAEHKSLNVNDKDEEITDEVYELKRREKGKNVEETRNSPILTPIRSHRIHTNLQVPEQVQNQVPVYVAEGLILERQKAKEETERLIAKAIMQERGNIQAQISTQIENAIANVIPSQVDASVRSYMSGHILHVHPAQSQTSSVPEQQYQLYLAMKADPQLQQQDITIWLALQMKFERNTVLQTACRTPAVRTRDQDDPHLEGENSAKWQKTSEYETYVSGESSSGQVFQEEQAPSTLEIVARRANDCIVSIIEPDYKNLNKNDIEDIYLLIINGKELKIMKCSLSSMSLCMELFTRIARNKFCDATLNRVLEGLKSYNNDIKYGYVQKDLTNDEVEYLKLFEEEIEERLKHRRQMRRWEMFVNGRPLGPRRERPE
ncbi:hypothetical protein Tco_1032481 [Tanacetum coccineum]|uniref:Uncharacterized protein n=1 Tax=Tanacetum coccineum TaxID=301880 RepID=A0ABQ5GCJ0_9ASTR